MNGLDITLFLLITGFAVVEMFRGFGKGVLDALLLYAALWGADMLSPMLGSHIQFASTKAACHADADAILFIALGIISLMLSQFFYGMTLIDLGMLDKLLGLCCGIAAGMIVAHGIVHVMAMSDPDGNGGAALVASSSVGNQMLDFPAYHSFMQTITGANSYNQSLPAGVGK